MADVIIPGNVRSIVQGETRTSKKAMYKIAVEQMRKDSSPVLVEVLSFVGVEGLEVNKHAFLSCFDTIDSWKDKRTGEMKSRIKYIFKNVVKK